MHQKRRNNMLIVCFLRKTLMFTNTDPDAKERKLVISVKHMNYIGVKKVI